MLIRIEAPDLPGETCGPSPDMPGGYANVQVGVQRSNRREELLGLTRSDAPAEVWSFGCTASPSPAGVDLLGPYIQGPPGGRFIYLSWETVGDAVDAATFTLFRRATLWLDAVPAEVLEQATKSGELIGRLGLTDRKGNPLCAAARPPAIEWSAR